MQKIWTNLYTLHYELRSTIHNLEDKQPGISRRRKIKSSKLNMINISHMDRITSDYWRMSRITLCARKLKSRTIKDTIIPTQFRINLLIMEDQYKLEVIRWAPHMFLKCRMLPWCIILKCKMLLCRIYPCRMITCRMLTCKMLQCRILRCQLNDIKKKCTTHLKQISMNNWIILATMIAHQTIKFNIKAIIIIKTKAI